MSVGPSARPSDRNAFVNSGEMYHLQRNKYGETLLICLICVPLSLWHDLSVGRSVRQNKWLSLSISIYSPRTHHWPLGLVFLEMLETNKMTWYIKIGYQWKDISKTHVTINYAYLNLLVIVRIIRGFEVDHARGITKLNLGLACLFLQLRS